MKASRWLLEPLGQACVVNPRLPRSHGLADDHVVSFVPMAAVDEAGGQIVSLQARPFSEVKKGYTHFEDGDVLFAKITPCMENGKAAIARELLGGHGFGSTEFHVVRPQPHVLPEWVFYFVRRQSFRAEAKRSFTGTAGQQRVPTTFMELAMLPVPPLAEQRRLVDVLSRTEGIVRLRREAEKKATELIPALFLDMVGHPATNTKGWPVVPFSQFGNCRLGKMLDKKKQSRQFQKPYLRNVNVQWDRIDTYDLLEMDFRPEEQDTFKLKPGDVLICEGGAIGRAAVWNGQTEECYYQKALHRLRPDTTTTRADFVVWLLWHLAHSGALTGATILSTIAHLTGVQLKNFQVICPPIEIQDEFERLVAQCHSIQSQQHTATEKAEATFNPTAPLLKEP